ncbi:MAG: hypothetical protein ACLF0G_16930 [Candidatus Brocadiia bacterium]
MSQPTRRTARRFDACPLSRRGFLAGCAACAAAGARSLGAQEAAKPRVRLVFTHIPRGRPTWPYSTYDYEGRKKELTARLAKACPDVDFLPATAHNQGEAKKLLERDDEVDGYLVYMVGIWTRAPQTIGAAGKPTLFVDDLYAGSGEFLIAYAAARRRGWKVEGISSSRFDDVAAAARCFTILKQPDGSPEAFLEAVRKSRRANTPEPGDLACKDDPVACVPMAECQKKLRASKVLTVGGGWGMPRSGKAIAEVFGTEVVRIEFKELHQAYLEADRDEARAWADRWSKDAARIVEPSREDIEKSGAMYLGMLKVLERRGANAITINCLGGFYGNHLQAYPCLGFRQLNDDGLVGACESDLFSTITMLAVGALTGRPGFISDPVMDTARRHIIYAHCVGPTKVFGPDGASNPYHIRSHSEDRKGAAIRSLLPLGYLTTTVETRPRRREIILHQGKSAENVDEDKACRTKLAVEPLGDYEKLFDYWDRWGWHRVTFYGDLAEPVRQLAKAHGLRVVEEA